MGEKRDRTFMLRREWEKSRNKNWALECMELELSDGSTNSTPLSP